MSRRGPTRRALEPAAGPEEELQVEEGEGDEGHLGAAGAAQDGEAAGDCRGVPRGVPGAAGRRRRRGGGVAVGGAPCVRHGLIADSPSGVGIRVSPGSRE